VKDAIAIIPARGGSKRIPRKNIREFHGKPLIAYSIETALQSNLFEKVVVSTDDEEIAEISEKYGAEVPFRRPKELSDDFTGTEDVTEHTVSFLEGLGEFYEYNCTIYATAPLLQVKYLIEGYDRLKSSDAINSFSATSMSFPIWRTFEITENNRAKMFWEENAKKRSQDLPEAYQDAGQFYWSNRRGAKGLRGKKILFSEISIPIILPRYLVQDIDTLEDWERCEFMYEAIERGKKIAK
jgi:N-acylneuraminate cytidylyltransferase